MVNHKVDWQYALQARELPRAEWDALCHGPPLVQGEET
jgi:hypothetical protein